jgi:hypothetical protein
MIGPVIDLATRFARGSIERHRRLLDVYERERPQIGAERPTSG